MNVVTGEVDRGPVVSYCRFPIVGPGMDELWSTVAAPVAGAGDPLYDEIRRRGVERERPFLVETLAAIESGALSIPPGAPVDLTDEVEMRLAGERV